MMISLFIYFVLGYAFAFGESSAGVIGAQSNYATVFRSNNQYHERQFSYYFATVLIVIVISTGGLAERGKLEALIGFVVI